MSLPERITPAGPLASADPCRLSADEFIERLRLLQAELVQLISEGAPALLELLVLDWFRVWRMANESQRSRACCR